VKTRFQNLPFKCNLQRYTVGRRAEVHALILLAVFATSFVLLATSATAVTPTVAAIVLAHAGLVFARGTHELLCSSCGGALSVMDAVALVTLMACSGALMCAISRAEDGRSRGNFVKEFRRRQEQRRWAALISNMLPPAVVALLQKKNRAKKPRTPRSSSSPAAADGSGHGNGSGGPLSPPAAADDDDDDGAPPTMAWKLPHTCIFQSDIVGFTVGPCTSCEASKPSIA
jgi:hypothetical protein